MMHQNQPTVTINGAGTMPQPPLLGAPLSGSSSSTTTYVTCSGERGSLSTRRHSHLSGRSARRIHYGNSSRAHRRKFPLRPPLVRMSHYEPPRCNSCASSDSDFRVAVTATTQAEDQIVLLDSLPAPFQAVNSNAGYKADREACGTGRIPHPPPMANVATSRSGGGGSQDSHSHSRRGRSSTRRRTHATSQTHSSRRAVSRPRGQRHAPLRNYSRPPNNLEQAPRLTATSSTSSSTTTAAMPSHRAANMTSSTRSDSNQNLGSDRRAARGGMLQGARASGAQRAASVDKDYFIIGRPEKVFRLDDRCNIVIGARSPSPDRVRRMLNSSRARYIPRGH